MGGFFNIPQGSDLGSQWAMGQDPLMRKRLAQMVMESAAPGDETEAAPADFGGRVVPNPSHLRPQLDTDPSIPPTRLPKGVSFDKGNYRGGAQFDLSNPASADVAPPLMQTVAAGQGQLQDRINDDTTRSPGGFEGTGAQQAMTSRMSLADQVRQQREAQPSRLDQMQAQYDQMGQQQPMTLKQKLLRGFVGAFGDNATRQRMQQRDEFQQGQRTGERERLLNQIEAERRMQEEQGRMDQQEDFQREQTQAGRDWQAQNEAPPVQQTDQGMIQYNRQTRQWEPVMVNGQAVGPKAQPKPDTPEQQTIDYYTSKGMTLPQAIRQYAQDSQKPEQPQRPQQQLAVTPDGKVIELRPGMTMPEGTQTIGGEMKAKQGEEGATAAQGYANDYLERKDFTGPGDEALMEKFFELAKPSSGFRMTQAQIDMLRGARSAMGGMEARAKHFFTPNAPWFSDTQRQQIVSTMNELAAARKGQSGGSLKAQVQNSPLKYTPGLIRNGYRFKGGDPTQQSSWEKVQP